MAIQSVVHPDDPRVAAFRDIRERDLTGRDGLFIAEGEVVVRTLFSAASLCRPRALLIAESRLHKQARLVAEAPAGLPIYAAAQPVLDAIAGFPLHRGILALGEKPEHPDPERLLESLPDRGVVVVCAGIGNHDNMGGLFRNAAAFGAEAVLLDDRCCDPFYRKAIRVSVGAVMRTPSAAPRPLSTLIATLEAADFEIIALSPSATERLADLRPRGRQALLLGSEGPGLPETVLARLRTVGVPMAGGFDSLNVAATSAVGLYQLTQATTA